MANGDIRIKVFVITYRRPHLLERALRSLITQTHTNWIAEVINDDPADERVNTIVNQINDERICLSTPAVKRGGTVNFNYAFTQASEAFATVLEDDNWYEPQFMELTLQALTSNPQAQMAVANEKIWIEEHDGSWTNANKTIWPELSGTSLFSFKLHDKCGQAKICNSSMLWRTATAASWLTPANIPIDVTEHFRERVIPHPILLVNTPLVNFAQTLQSNRSSQKTTWGEYQTLLISSAFVGLDNEKASSLADTLWLDARSNNAPYKTSLLHSGLSHPDAFVLFKKATPAELFKYSLTWLRHPADCSKVIKAPKTHANHFNFLINALKPKDH